MLAGHNARNEITRPIASRRSPLSRFTPRFSHPETAKIALLLRLPTPAVLGASAPARGAPPVSVREGRTARRLRSRAMKRSPTRSLRSRSRRLEPQCRSTDSYGTRAHRAHRQARACDRAAVVFTSPGPSMMRHARNMRLRQACDVLAPTDQGLPPFLSRATRVLAAKGSTDEFAGGHCSIPPYNSPTPASRDARRRSRKRCPCCAPNHCEAVFARHIRDYADRRCCRRLERKAGGSDALSAR